MPDEFPTVPIAPAVRPRTGRRFGIGLLLLLLIGAGLIAWLEWRGTIQLGALTGGRSAAPTARLAETVPAPVPPPAPAAAPVAPAPVAMQVGTVEARLALLEDRLSRIDLRAEAASGNAARAEGLLIAFAARRMVERGAPLGYLEDQLRLRFADAQPNAVKAIVDGAAQPVTLDRLLVELDKLDLAMADAASSEGAWTRFKQEVSGLFVIRRQDTPSLGPKDRLQRAKLMLTTGKVGEAISEVRYLPGAESARDWIAQAQRYDSIRRALDLIETTAMLDPDRLQDSAGNRVVQPSPLAAPAETGKSTP